MIRLPFVIVLVLLFCTKNAKSSRIDTSAIESMVLEAYRLESNYPDSAFQLARKVHRLSEEANYTMGLSYALMRMGSIKNIRGQNDTALILIKQALQLRKELENYSGASATCITLSYIYKETGQIDSAFYIMYEARRLNAIVGDAALDAEIQIKLGHLFLDYKNIDEALTYFQEAEKIALRLNNEGILLQVYSAFANYYLLKEDYLSALDYNKKTNSILLGLNDRRKLYSNYCNLALCYDKLKETQLAVLFYKKALEESIHLGMKGEESLIYFNLGSLYSNRGQVDTSIYYLNKSLELAILNNDLHRQNKSYEYLSDEYTLIKDYEKAYQYRLKHEKLKDSILNKEKITSISEMQTKYETEKKEQQIELLNEQNKTQKAQRNFLIAASSALLLLLIVIGIFYVQRNRIAKKNEQIAQQKIESLLDEQEIKTYNAMLEGQEEERMRIATDLHDRLGSMLSTVKLLFSALDEKIDKAQRENQQQYEKANTLLDEACVEVRRISHNLGTGMVANFGLNRALEELCEGIDHSGKLKCQYLVYGLESVKLKLKVEVGIYRMVQEAFNNAIKHAEAKKLSLQLNVLEDHLNLTIEDDGKGFDPNKIVKGMGLENLDKRAKNLGGKLHIDSRKGKGTIVIIDLPKNILA